MQLLFLMLNFMITPFLKFIILLIVLAVISAITYFIYNKKNQNNKSILTLPFPEGWRNILNEHVKFYRDIAEYPAMIVALVVSSALGGSASDRVGSQRPEKRDLLAAEIIAVRETIRRCGPLELKPQPRPRGARVHFS